MRMVTRKVAHDALPDRHSARLAVHGWWRGAAPAAARGPAAAGDRPGRQRAPRRPPRRLPPAREAVKSSQRLKRGRARTRLMQQITDQTGLIGQVPDAAATARPPPSQGLGHRVLNNLPGSASARLPAPA
jgi:hypothetical protein